MAFQNLLSVRARQREEDVKGRQMGGQTARTVRRLIVSQSCRQKTLRRNEPLDHEGLSIDLHIVMVTIKTRRAQTSQSDEMYNVSSPSVCGGMA